MIRFLPLLFCATTASAADIDWLSDEVVSKALQAVVTVETHHAFAAAGFFASEDGLIVTNAVNLRGAKAIDVITESGQKIKGVKLLMVRPDHDLAVLATGIKAPAHLKIRDSAAAAGEPCVVLYNGGQAIIKAADGVLIARGRECDQAGTGFIDLWSVLLAPDKMGIAGAPAITSDGCVAAVSHYMTGTGTTKRNLFLPESPIREILAQARATRVPLPLPPPPAGVGVSEIWDDPIYKEGLRLVSLGDMAAAREPFRAALSRHPQDIDIMGNLAGANLAMGDTAEAERLLRECIRLAPQQMINHVRLGSIIDLKGDSRIALQYFREITARFPDLGDGWVMLSASLLKAGQPAEAASAAKKCTELQPGSFPLWNTYADALSANGEFTEAGRARDRAHEIEDIIFKIRYDAPKRKK